MVTTRASTPADLTEETVEKGSPWAWKLRVLALVVGFAAIAWARSRQVDIPFKDPHGKLFRAKIVDTAEILVLFILADIVVRWLRGRREGATLWSTVRTRWTPYRIVMVAAGLVAYFVVYLSYRNLKSWDVLLTQRDAMLQRWDRALFLGHTPAVLLHDLLGEDLAARLLTDLYESFSWLVTFALVAALAFTPTVRQAYVFVVAAMWTWILGVGSYYLIPSLGPFHEVPQVFAGLRRTSIQSTQERYLEQRAHLLAHPQAHDAFAQISAFASLHCALTCLIWLAARYYGLRILSWVAFAFLVGTMIATVYLGWHFAVDDVAGIAIAWVAFQLGKLTVMGTRKIPPRGAPTP